MTLTIFHRGFVTCFALMALLQPTLSFSQAASPAPGAVSSPIKPVALVDEKSSAINAVEEPDYKIGSQDLLDISVYGQPDFTRTVRVNARGKISMPMIGQLDTVGLTALQLERLIADRLSENLLQNPQVTVFVKESISARFTIEGAVGRPGVFPIQGQVTLLRALAIAGGRGALGDLSNVKLFRTLPNGKQDTLTFDIDKIRTGEAADPQIMNEDLIVVAQSKVRAVLKDSLFGDFLGLVNPFSIIKP